jgi:hypothetical protein
MSKFITSDPPYNAGLYPTTAGFLQLENGEPLDGFSRIVTDQLGTTSPLSLSSTNLSITSYSNTTPPAIKAAPSFASTSGLDIWGATNSATEYEFIRFRNFNGELLSQIYNYNSLLTFKVGSNEIVNLSATQARIGSTNNNTPLALFGSNSLSAIFNISNISVGGDKTFTFPNANMTFAGIDIAQTFTAAQTFNSPSEAGLNGSPIRILTDPWTSGNANQNHPLLLFGPHGGGIWAASPNGGTYIGINAVASFPGNFLDFHVNGGASLFRVSSTGAVTSTSSMTLGSSSLSAIRLYVRSDGTNSVFRVDNSTPQRLFEVDNNNRLILGNSGLLLAYGNSNFALTSQLPTGYSYIFGNGTTKASASAVMGTFQLNESISNPSGANSSYRGVELNYSINNSAGAVTGTATGILVNGTETGSGLNGMTHNLMDLQRGGVSQFRVDRVGAFSCGNTVASAFAVSSTHKVTVVIGGVTYYLLASNV